MDLSIWRNAFGNAQRSRKAQNGPSSSEGQGRNLIEHVDVLVLLCRTMMPRCLLVIGQNYQKGRRDGTIA